MKMSDFDSLLRQRFTLRDDSFLLISSEDDYTPQYSSYDNWKCVYSFALPDTSFRAGLRRSMRRFSFSRRRSSNGIPQTPQERVNTALQPHLNRVLDLLSSESRHFPSNLDRSDFSIGQLYQTMPMYDKSLDECNIHPYTIVQVFEVTGPYGGMVITPAKPASSVDAVDLAVLPGAIDIDRVVSDDSIMAAARHLAEAAATATSVCTGAFLLGSLGRLDGLRWTTHFEDVDALAQRLGSDQGTAMVTWVNTGDVVTSGGLSSGIAMALHLVERYATRDLAVATARQLEYAWNPDAGIETRSATIPRNASLEGP